MIHSFKRMSSNSCIVTRIENNLHISDLFSYETLVASYYHEENRVKIFGWYSKTTQKHINQFLEYFGFDKMTKKEIINVSNLI